LAAGWPLTIPRAKLLPQVSPARAASHLWPERRKTKVSLERREQPAALGHCPAASEPRKWSAALSLGNVPQRYQIPSQHPNLSHLREQHHHLPSCSGQKPVPRPSPLSPTPTFSHQAGRFLSKLSTEPRPSPCPAS
jgi:hypothetical protein